MPDASGEAERIRSYYRSAAWRPSRGRAFLIAEWRDLVKDVLAADGTDVATLCVCDVGCGGGSDLAHWRALGVPERNLFGTELVAERAEVARGAMPAATIAHVEGFEIPFADRSFDLVTASLVLSSVVNPVGRATLAAEMRRVARPGGLIAIYDFAVRKPWNRQVRAVGEAELASTLGQPWRRHAVSPFLPALDAALRLPVWLGHAVIGVLPRTHRLWLWRA